MGQRYSIVNELQLTRRIPCGTISHSFDRPIETSKNGVPISEMTSHRCAKRIITDERRQFCKAYRKFNPWKISSLHVCIPRLLSTHLDNVSVREKDKKRFLFGKIVIRIKCYNIPVHSLYKWFYSLHVYRIYIYRHLLIQTTCVFAILLGRERQLHLYGHVRDSLRGIPPIGFFLVEIRGAGPWRGASTRSWLRQVESFLKDTGMVGLASAWAMRPEEVEEVPSQGGRGDALLRRMPPYLTWSRLCSSLKSLAARRNIRITLDGIQVQCVNFDHWDCVPRPNQTYQSTNFP